MDHATLNAKQWLLRVTVGPGSIAKMERINDSLLECEQLTTINDAVVRREASAISPMPPGLLNVLTENQILDLLAFLESGGDPQHADFKP